MDKEVTLIFGGDFCPTEHVESALCSLDDPSELLGPAASLFRQSDLAIVNLEYPLTRVDKKLVKYGSHQKGCPETISVLKEAGVGLVSLANNHILDFGAEGMADTVRTCEAAGIAIVGAGKTAGEAAKPYNATIKGKRIAFLGICENEFSIAKGGRGGANGLDPISNHYAIAEARSKADLVIVLFHGGNEFTHYPSPRTMRTCRFFADSGASAVICHHPHYVQGYEVYQGVPILYSLGKLLYTKMSDPDILEIPVARVSFSSSRQEPAVDFEFFQLSLQQMRLVAMTEDKAAAMKERFRGYSEALASEEIILKKWNEYCKKREYIYLALALSIHPLLYRFVRRIGVERFVKRYALLKKKELLTLENLIRCESHQEALLHILEGIHSQ
jgi:poly-gamma-glutamate synthesis protein (capsule biosynthesis protein)